MFILYLCVYIDIYWEIVYIYYFETRVRLFNVLLTCVSYQICWHIDGTILLLRTIINDVCSLVVHRPFTNEINIAMYRDITRLAQLKTFPNYTWFADGDLVPVRTCQRASCRYVRNVDVLVRCSSSPRGKKTRELQCHWSVNIPLLTLNICRANIFLSN